MTGPASSPRLGRRALLRGAGVAAAALALRPSGVFAASGESDVLTGLWRREIGAAIAYAAVLGTDPSLALIRSHETHHAAAVATELAATGLGTPRPPATVEQLDIAAQLLAGSGPKRADVLAAAIALEEGLVAAYQDALPVLKDENVAMTAATILGSHAQHLLMLRQAAGVT